MFDHVRARVPERDQPLGEIVRRSSIPLTSSTGGISPRVGTRACSRRARGRPGRTRPWPPAAGARRRPGARDLRRGADPSYGSASHEGRSAAPSSPSQARAPREPSASRGPGATSSTERRAPGRAPPPARPRPRPVRATGRERSSSRRSNASEPIRLRRAPASPHHPHSSLGFVPFSCLLVPWRHSGQHEQAPSGTRPHRSSSSLLRFARGAIVSVLRGSRPSAISGRTASRAPSTRSPPPSRLANVETQSAACLRPVGADAERRTRKKSGVRSACCSERRPLWPAVEPPDFTRGAPGQIDLVVHRDHVVGFDAVLARERGDRRTALVHERADFASTTRVPPTRISPTSAPTNRACGSARPRGRPRARRRPGSRGCDGSSRRARRGCRAPRRARSWRRGRLALGLGALSSPSALRPRRPRPRRPRRPRPRRLRPRRLLLELDGHLRLLHRDDRLLGGSGSSRPWVRRDRSRAATSRSRGT